MVSDTEMRMEKKGLPVVEKFFEDFFNLLTPIYNKAGFA
jgi:hypothetical protein